MQVKYKKYQQDLNIILESEIFGRALFAMAAKTSQKPEQQQKWLRLQLLEQQTLERLQDFLAQTQQHAKARKHIQFKGKVLGYVLAKLPWPIAMYLLKDGTAPFMKVFERLTTHADQPTKAFFEYILAHEKSIYDFAQKELQKQPTHSLAQVNLLLAT